MFGTLALAGALLFGSPGAARREQQPDPDPSPASGAALLGSAAAVGVGASILYSVTFAEAHTCGHDEPASAGTYGGDEYPESDGFDFCGVPYELIGFPIYLSLTLGAVQPLVAGGAHQLGRFHRLAGRPDARGRWHGMIVGGALLHAIGVAGMFAGLAVVHEDPEAKVAVAGMVFAQLGAAAQATGLGLLMYGASSYRHRIRPSFSFVRGGAQLSLTARF